MNTAGYLSKQVLSAFKFEDLVPMEQFLNRQIGETTGLILMALGTAIVNPGIAIDILPDQLVDDTHGTGKHTRMMAAHKRAEASLIIDKLGLQNISVGIGKDNRPYIVNDNLVRVRRKTIYELDPH